MDAGIEVGIKGTVRVGVDDNFAWQMRHKPQAEPLLRLNTSVMAGHSKERVGRWLEFLFIHDNPKSGGDEEIL